MEPNEATAEAKKQFIEAVKQGTHILVTVKSNPTVDQLASCIALTVLLNELGKRATAVFSGKVPATIEFLEPNKMLQRTTNSLQDFIISLDKVKADKLRYKVEDTMVKIYITPYQTSISDKDLVYSKGDFNVDVVIAMGAHSQAELDKAITSHGRILHDATIISMNNVAGPTSELGSVNWVDENASSLSEMLAQAVEDIADGKQDVLDTQVATALLAGIVAETESFGNSKTSPETMEVAGHLLASGANQELVATKLTGPLKHDSPAAHPAPEAPHPHGRKHKDADDKDKATSDDSKDDSKDEAVDDDSSAGGELLTGTALAAHGDPELPDEPVDLINQPATSETDTEVETEVAAETDTDTDASAATDVGTTTDAESTADDTPKEENEADKESTEDSPLVDIVDTSALTDVAADLSEGASETAKADSSESAPQIYDLSDSNAPASVPDAVAEATASSTDAPAADPGLLQPLRDQNGLVDEPPLQDKVAEAAQEGSTAPVDSSLDPTKFALSPPSLGGRLSGADDEEAPAPPANPLAEAGGPAVVTTHHSMMTHGAPGVPGSDAPADAAPAVAPAGPVEMHHEKKLVVPGTEPAAANPLAGLEVVDPNAPLAAPVTPASSASPVPATFGTTDANELAALGIIQPGGASAAPAPGMAPNAPPAGVTSAPMPGFMPASPQPVGSAPPLGTPPQ